MTQLGFVGLGLMGGGVVKRLLDTGHSVTGWNRTKSRGQWLVDLGMHWGETPRLVAQTVDVTFSMVANTEALRAVTSGPDGIIAGLGPGKVYVDMSTVSPASIRELASQVEATGAHLLDAPVSGSSTTLEEGQLSFMVGGDPTVLDQVHPVLRDIGSKVTHVGQNGMAAAMKVATNLSLPVQMLAFSEGLLLAEKSGIPRQAAIEVLLNSVIASPMIRYRAPLVMDRSYEGFFDVTMIQKDLELALEMGRELNVPLQTAAVTNQMLNSTRAMGFADKDFAIIYEALGRMSGSTQ